MFVYHSHMETATRRITERKNSIRGRFVVLLFGFILKKHQGAYPQLAKDKHAIGTAYMAARGRMLCARVRGGVRVP